MRTHILADDVVRVELTADEHVALVDAITDAVTIVEPLRMRDVLACDEATARAFVASLHALEHDAFSQGVTWLQPQTRAGATGTAVLHVEFTDDGSHWHVSLEQLAFIEACADQEHRSDQQERAQRDVALADPEGQSPTHSE